MNRNKITIAALITAAAILAVVIIAAVIYNIQPEDTTPSEETSAQEISNENSVLENDASVHGWVINRMGYTYLYNDRALLQFNGTTRSALRYAEAINRIADTADTQRIYSIVVPTQVEFLNIPVSVMAEDNFFCTSQSEAVFTTATATDGIKDIDITDLLYAHIDEYLYFRTDYNWTALAAYYAYTAFCQSASLNPIPIEQYEAVELNNYLGWFYTATESKMLLDNSDTIVYYRTEAEYPCYITVEENGHKTYKLKYYGTDIDAEKGYDVFIGKEKAVYRFETRAKGGSLLVVGDTSAHAFLPFLMPHYSEIIFYNPSCFVDGTEYPMPETDEVLFISYATNANNAAFCNKLEGIT